MGSMHLRQARSQHQLNPPSLARHPLPCNATTACNPPKPTRARPTAAAGARVEFPEGEDPAHYDLRIIECSYDPGAACWRFMRERRDKDTPNAQHVYESVARSIQARAC